MKKIYNLLISCSLALIAFFSVSTSNIALAKAEESSIDVKRTFTGTHEGLDKEELESNKDADSYIVKDGDFKYQIVMSEKQTAKDADALKEFKILLKRAIGNVPVSVVFDGDFTEFNQDAAYISIGYTKLLELASEIDSDLNEETLREELGQNGLRIKTVGKSIFLVGGVYNGILNAVYKFFNLTFNYEQFTKNCLTIDTNVENKNLYNFDVTDLPDVEYCSATYGPIASFTTPKESDYKALMQGDITRSDVATEIRLAGERLKFTTKTNNNLVILASGDHRGVKKSSSNHSTLIVMSESNKNAPGNEEIEVKPGVWYSDGQQQQLCYTARGDADEVKVMQQFAANYMISKMKVNDTIKAPGADFYPFANMDGNLYCTCEACISATEKYNGAYSGVNIEFVNGLCEIIEQAQQESLDDGDDTNDAWVRPDFKILVFAYQNTKQPPVEYNEELGKYVGLNGLELNEHICVMFTDYPISRYAFYDERESKKIEGVLGWGDIAHHLYSWNHAEAYQSKGVFLDCLNGINTDRIQHMASMGVIWNFTEVQSSNEVVSTWHNLHYYMIGQITWDSNSNSGELIDKFFNAYYGIAADTMKALYYNHRTFTAHMIEQYYKDNNDKILGVGFKDWSEREYPYEMIKRWWAQTEHALQQVEQYKNIDMNLYDTYKDRVNVEAIQYVWLVYQYYRQIPPFSLEEKQNYIERALDIATRYKNAYFKESDLRDWAKN